MAQIISGTLWQSKEPSQERCMKFYDENESLYLETDTSGLTSKRKNDLSKGHDTGQLPVKTRSICEQEPIQCEKHNTTIIERGARHTAQLPKIPSLLFCQRATIHDRPKAPGSYIQERNSNAIVETIVHPTEDTPI